MDERDVIYEARTTGPGSYEALYGWTRPTDTELMECQRALGFSSATHRFMPHSLRFFDSETPRRVTWRSSSPDGE